ncbi:unnamed protein product [Pleuronectes platessa]|uniref:Uncharacterized protein n=1 Tax=Pleuronectes platessa TaxID=8262 RepID=A0A9N7VTF6_PLEPL|nr:unnamed protein product [Pleuronectes platessa]
MPAREHHRASSDGSRTVRPVSARQLSESREMSGGGQAVSGRREETSANVSRSQPFRVDGRLPISDRPQASVRAEEPIGAGSLYRRNLSIIPCISRSSMYSLTSSPSPKVEGPVPLVMSQASSLQCLQRMTPDSGSAVSDRGQSDLKKQHSSEGVLQPLVMKMQKWLKLMWRRPPLVPRIDPSSSAETTYM